MAKPDITGTVIMEERMDHPDGRKVVLVVGLVAMPADVAARYCNSRPTQSLIVGNEGAGLLRMSVVEGQTTEPEDASGYVGYRVDQLLTSPIWRL